MTESSCDVKKNMWKDDVMLCNKTLATSFVFYLNGKVGSRHIMYCEIAIATAVGDHRGGEAERTTRTNICDGPL